MLVIPLLVLPPRFFSQWHHHLYKGSFQSWWLGFVQKLTHAFVQKLILLPASGLTAIGLTIAQSDLEFSHYKMPTRK